MRVGPSNRLAGGRTQITFRCCVLSDVVVSGEGKGSGEKLGSDDFQQEDRKGTTVSRVEKSQDDAKTAVVRRSRDKFRRSLFTGGTASGVQVG
jgi:hypothetical protein